MRNLPFFTSHDESAIGLKQTLSIKKARSKTRKKIWTKNFTIFGQNACFCVSYENVMTWQRIKSDFILLTNQVVRFHIEKKTLSRL